MKYEAELQPVAALLPTASSILIVLPAQVNIDNLASGLALFLSLVQAGKQVSIATEGIIRVEHTSLFGVGKIQNKLPQSRSGDFVVTLGGVVAPDGTIPSAEKVDYYPTGADLNLVIRVKPGQKFEPTHVTPRHEDGNISLIFTVGAVNLESLGSLYTLNPQLFTNTQLVNIDNQQQNSQFGKTNVVDATASSLSEIMSGVITALHLPMDQDTATNLLQGIFEATSNLQSNTVSAETYEAVASAVRAGGKKPVITSPAASTPANPVVSGPTPSSGFDLSKVFQAPINQPAESFTMPPVVSSTPQTENQPSPEEAPQIETTVTPEDDWLTPKIYKGKGAIG